MMSNGKNVIESKCFNKILAHYDGIIEFNNQKNWNSSPGNQWWVIALRFFLKAFSWQNLNPIKKNQKSKCIFIENYTYIYFSLLILCSCKLLKHLEQLDSKALLLNPIVSSLPSCMKVPQKAALADWKKVIKFGWWWWLLPVWCGQEGRSSWKAWVV